MLNLGENPTEIYLLVAVLCLLPLLPGELAVLTGGVLAGAGELDLGLLVLAASVGAWLGDLVTFCGAQLLAARPQPARSSRQPSPAALPHWARLDRLGGLPVVLLRLVPGGRTPLAVSAGLSGSSGRFFASRVAIGATVWALLYALLGYLTGTVVGRPTQWLSVTGAVAVGLVVLLPLLLRRTHRSGRDDRARVG